MKETSLYRHFDADGRLLYVGIALCAIYRLDEHMERSAWRNSIKRVEIERHPTRRHAKYAEAVAIRDEKPIHNVVKPIPRDPDIPAPEATKVLPAHPALDHLRGRISYGFRVKDLAEEFGVTVQVMSSILSGRRKMTKQMLSAAIRTGAPPL